MKALSEDKRVYVFHDVSSFSNLFINHLKNRKGSKFEESVVIKPNLCCSKPAETGATTDPKLVEIIIKCLRNQGFSKISIVESSTLHNNVKKTFRILGYTDLAEEFGVDLVDLCDEALVKKDFSKGRFFKGTVYLPEILSSCTLFISISNMKTHHFEKISCSLKNLFGCLADENKDRYHPHLSEVFHDLCRILNPELCIVDGKVGMEGFGPIDGKPVDSNTILVGRNPVSVDSVAAKIMGFNPEGVPHLRKCAKWGIGSLNAEIVGGSCCLNFAFIPGSFYTTFRFYLFFARIFPLFFRAVIEPNLINFLRLCHNYLGLE